MCLAGMFRSKDHARQALRSFPLTRELPSKLETPQARREPGSFIFSSPLM